MRLFPLFFLVAAVPVLAQPAIKQLQNNYSYTLPGLQLDWTNKSSLSTVSRAQGFGVTWAGGSANGYVRITGSSSSVNFDCSAPVSAGQFQVPSAILLSMPPSATGTLTVYDYGFPSYFSATGLDVGFVPGEANTTIAVSYQ